MKKALYKFHADCGRMGELEGLFIANPEVIEWLIASKLDVYFGEVLGKHSEVYFEMNHEYFTCVTDDKTVIDAISKHKIETGFNPLNIRLLGADDMATDEEGYHDDISANELFEIIRKRK